MSSLFFVWANHVSHSQAQVPARRWKGARFGGIPRRCRSPSTTPVLVHNSHSTQRLGTLATTTSSSAPRPPPPRPTIAATPVAVVAAPPNSDLSLLGCKERTIGFTQSWPIRRWGWILFGLFCTASIQLSCPLRAKGKITEEGDFFFWNQCLVFFRPKRGAEAGTSLTGNTTIAMSVANCTF